jgi:hypothetical protein
MSNHRPVLVFGVFESDGPRPPGVNAGVSCQDAVTPRAIVAIACADCRLFFYSQGAYDVIVGARRGAATEEPKAHAVALSSHCDIFEQDVTSFDHRH